MSSNQSIEHGMRIKLGNQLPPYPTFKEGIRRAPKREFTLSKNQTRIALMNALRYIPEELHETLAPEFMEELKTHGRIYGYRYRPEGALSGKPIDQYKGVCTEGKAIQVMIDNNLDFDIALYPYELVTYGETGQVCHDNPEWQNKAQAMGVANYGQMTAGGWMYIGPQGIVHGTFNTVMNAGRLKLGISGDQDLAGVLYVTSGLGGMSGAQGKAIKIANGVGIIAEVDFSRVMTRYEQGWVDSYSASCEEVFAEAKKYMDKGEGRAIAFHGNIVDLLDYALNNDIKIDLLSDQTSCHVPYDGGYCPQGISFEERTAMLANDKENFIKKVDQSLQEHFRLVKALVDKGSYFFDYGNAFMKAVYDTGVTEITKNGVDESEGFIFPSYVEDIMGPMLFDYGYGPFRWVCLSGKPEDLHKTDQAAMHCIDPNRRGQDRDNYVWVRDAEKNKLVVGTQARILYQDAMGRLKIALKFNEMVRNGEIGPVMLGRDHHDTGGTDSPFRETSNIKDGSNVMAEMAVHCFAGNAARGMSMIALHNGGGVGISKSINGGFGMVLDGSERVDRILQRAMPWDTMIGVARRNWARNPNGISTCIEYNDLYGDVNHITLPYIADETLVEKLVDTNYEDCLK